MQVPEEIRRRVKEVTMDFSDSMYSIIRQTFPWATIVIDCFHIMQLCGDGLCELRMKLEPRMETAYNLVHRLRCLFKSKFTPEEAKPKLDGWCKDVGKSLIRELISVRDTIRLKETETLNCFTNRSTNASAESLNSKIKCFRTQLRGIQNLPFFMYRLRVLFG